MAFRKHANKPKNKVKQEHPKRQGDLAAQVSTSLNVQELHKHQAGADRKRFGDNLHSAQQDITHTVQSAWVGIKLVCCPLSWKHEWGLRTPNAKHRHVDIYSWSFVSHHLISATISSLHSFLTFFLQHILPPRSVFAYILSDAFILTVFLICGPYLLLAKFSSFLKSYLLWLFLLFSS